MKILPHMPPGQNANGRPAVPACRRLIRQALKEDLGTGDVTSQALIPARRRATALIIARNHYVVSGLAVARDVFRELDPQLNFEIIVADGQRVRPKQPLASLQGRLQAILAAERTALNFLQRLTGIATLTASFLEKIQPHAVLILDTRKTTPLLRRLEKYAVLCGGGTNHRQGLYDRVLIKDNHRHYCQSQGISLATAIAKARRQYPRLLIEVEVETEAELRDALQARPDWILLDNMPLARLRRCVAINAGRALLEASGGITEENVRRIAASGVHGISLGCLTHSAPAADLALELLPNTRKPQRPC